MIIAEDGAPKRIYSYPPDGESSDVENVYNERVSFTSIYDDGDFKDKYRRGACMDHSRAMYVSCCITHASMKVKRELTSHHLPLQWLHRRRRA